MTRIVESALSRVNIRRGSGAQRNEIAKPLAAAGSQDGSWMPDGLGRENVAETGKNWRTGALTDRSTVASISPA